MNTLTITSAAQYYECHCRREVLLAALPDRAFLSAKEIEVFDELITLNTAIKAYEV